MDFIDLKIDINTLELMIKTDLFKEKFVRENKNWIAENIGKLFGDAEQRELEHAREIYLKAIEFESIENEIIKRREKIKSQMIAMPFNQQKVGEFDIEFGLRLDISIDEEADMPVHNMKEPSKLNKFKSIMSNWLDKARMVSQMREWVVAILPKGRTCSYCPSDFNLQVN